MINFIKKLLGFKITCANTGTPKETIREILTPQPKAEVSTATYIPPAKPVNKVRAVGDNNLTNLATKPANKKRRPYRGNKNAGGTVAKVNQPKPAVTEGATKGGNNSVKPAQVAKAKPHTPKAPVAKKK